MDLCETVAIYRIRPDWWFEISSGEGHLHAKTRQKRGHKFDFQEIDADRLTDWVQELKHFSDKLGVMPREKTVFSINAKTYTWYRDEAREINSAW